MITTVNYILNTDTFQFEEQEIWTDDNGFFFTDENAASEIPQEYVLPKDVTGDAMLSEFEDNLKKLRLDNIPLNSRTVDLALPVRQFKRTASALTRLPVASEPEEDPDVVQELPVKDESPVIREFHNLDEDEMEERWNDWVPAPGDPVWIYWCDSFAQFYPGTVKEVQDDPVDTLHVSYDDWGTDWDEWISLDRSYVMGVKHVDKLITDFNVRNQMEGIGTQKTRSEPVIRRTSHRSVSNVLKKNFAFSHCVVSFFANDRNGPICISAFTIRELISFLKDKEVSSKKISSLLELFVNEFKEFIADCIESFKTGYADYIDVHEEKKVMRDAYALVMENYEFLRSLAVSRYDGLPAEYMLVITALSITCL
ncbi:hypothetical protein PCE1_003646 [Barthelona sp. PCE]